MDFLHNLKLAYRFALIIGVMTAGFVIYGIWSFKTLEQIKVNGPIYQRIVQGKDLVADILPPPEYIIESYLVGMQLETSSVESRENLIERLKALKSEYDARHAYWEQADLSGELRQTLLDQAHQPTVDFYHHAFDEFVPAILSGDHDAAAKAMGKMKAAYETHRKAIDRVVQLANIRGKTDESDAAEQIKSSKIAMLVVLALVITLTIIIALLISGSIRVPLSIMQSTMLEIKNRHDFTRRIELHNTDEVGLTAQAFNELADSIHAALLQVLENANQVSRAAQELAASSQKRVISSAQQSSAASSIAATVEQVNVNIENVTSSAREAVDISRHSGDLSNRGGDIIYAATSAMMEIAETVQRTSSTIEDLGQQSHRISSVVQVIKDVADQTNLLALNAAIEAARAGEQGRGFAVVADEVRNLAKRTTKATEEISQMIATMQHSTGNAINVMSAAVNKADEGALIARQAGDAINQIKHESSKVVEVINNISSALIEQNSASNNIAGNVEQVALMAEENNHSIEQTALAASRLENLASTMRDLVSNFKL